MSETLSPVFAALGDETRWQILVRLGESPASASAVARDLPITRQAVVRHLDVLRAAGLVEANPRGREVVFTPLGGRLSALARELDRIADAGTSGCAGSRSCGSPGVAAQVIATPTLGPVVATTSRAGPAYRPRPGSIPDQPGVYRFSDAQGRVIYVGKAKSLRSRLNSYFADPANLLSRTRSMVSSAAKVDWTVVQTEVEALQLEYSWIKEFDPRFNIKYRDDKSYPWLAVTLSEEFPRVMVGRGAKRKGTRYYGPYSHAWAIRETVDLLLRVFPMRSCRPGVFKNHKQLGRPCLLGYIGKCSAPCVGRIDAARATGRSSTTSAPSSVARRRR